MRVIVMAPSGLGSWLGSALCLLQKPFGPVLLSINAVGTVLACEKAGLLCSSVGLLATLQAYIVISVHASFFAPCQRTCNDLQRFDCRALTCTGLPICWAVNLGCVVAGSLCADGHCKSPRPCKQQARQCVLDRTPAGTGTGLGQLKPPVCRSSAL